MVHRAAVEADAADRNAAQWEATAKELASRATHAETVYVHDTVTADRTLVRYRVVHDTVLAHLRDTVVVKQFIAQSDSTIHACTRALGDCGQVLALRDSIIGADAHTRTAQAQEIRHLK